MTEQMTEYVVLENLYHEGEDYTPGMMIELDNTLPITKSLLDIGTIALKPKPESTEFVSKVKPNVSTAS